MFDKKKYRCEKVRPILHGMVNNTYTSGLFCSRYRSHVIKAGRLCLVSNGFSGDYKSILEAVINSEHNQQYKAGIRMPELSETALLL